MMPGPFQLFPALPEAIESALTESIRRFGVLVPVVKDQHGNVVDGHHRMRIADALGVRYRVDVVKVADEAEGYAIAATLNTARRHLKAGQRREIVAHLRAEGHSLRAIAGAVGVDKSTVERDITGVSPETPDRTKGRDGKTYPARRPTLIAAKNEREAERAQQAFIEGADLEAGGVLDVKRAERIARERRAEQRRSEPTELVTVTQDLIELRHGDFREALADLEPTSVKAIITDPPYTRPMFETGDGLDALGAMAKEVLVPGGVLAVMFGTGTVPEVTAILGRHLPFRWCVAWLTPGPRARMHHAKVGTGWKPVYLYGDDPEDWLLDDVISSTGDEKDHHHWGQNLNGFSQLVERLTKPGDLVVDPFLGGGTTAVACLNLGRRFIGCDVDAAAVATARERVA